MMNHTLNHMMVPNSIPMLIQTARLVIPSGPLQNGVGPKPSSGVYM
jgi:hypothetical protein